MLLAFLLRVFLFFFFLKRDICGVALRVVEEDLRQIKGIGEKRLDEIMAVIEKHLGVEE